MGKLFFDVFPGLNVAEPLKELLAMAQVEKVTAARDRSSIRIYLRSSRLIHKHNIYDLEQGIKDQLFPDKKLTVRIQEKYRLSEQYTPKKLLELYKDSILLELKHYSIVEYNMFRKAQITFEGQDRMNMTVEDTMVNRDRVGELKRVLEKVFAERCGLPLEVTWRYVPPVGNELRKKLEERMEEEARQIYWQNHKDELPAGRAGAAFSGAKAAEGAAFVEGGTEGAPWDEGRAASQPGSAIAAGGAAARGGKNGAAPKKNGAKAEASSGAGAPKSGVSYGKAQAGELSRGRKKEGWGEKTYSLKRSDNPDVLYGRDFDDDFTPIEAIEGEMGEVTIRGKVLNCESRELRSGKFILTFDVTDFTDTITVKMFVRPELFDEVKGVLPVGGFIRIKGVTTIDRFDGELTLGSIVGIKKAEDFTSKRMDNSLEKRVELHCHTKMSDMDGVSEVKDIIKRAKKWGMSAIAVTDHGCVQAFPDANHALDKGDSFKVLYGVEGYLVDDTKQLVENPRNQSFADTYVVFDIETTGFSPEKNQIIEIGAVKVEDGRITDKFSTFVNPDVPIPFDIEKLTGINDAMVLPFPKIDVILPEFLEFVGDAVLVAHNASFDVGFISHYAEKLGLPFDPTVLDTVAMARVLLPNLNRYKLDTVAKALNISLENHHRAVDDAGCTAEIFAAFVKMFRERDVETLDQLNALKTMDEEMIKKLPTYHVILLAKNDIGRINLYRRVSLSALT